MAERILLIEDDDKIRGIIRDYFTAKSEGNYEITEAATGEDGILLAEKEKYDLFLLDIMLPGMDGFTICQKLRKISDSPILFLTARTREDDRLYGYEIGCDDYICKPFSFAELYAKVTAFLRRTKDSKSEDLICGSISLNLKSLILKIDGAETELPPKEFEILSYLMQHKGWTVSRETLLERIWNDYAYVETRVVDNHVKNLRKALGPAGKMIKTVNGRGYKLTDPSDNG